MSVSQSNHEQVRRIRRYHCRMCKRDATTTLEQAARHWIGKYAALWRKHLSRDSRRR